MATIVLAILLAALVLRAIDAFCTRMTAQGRVAVLAIVILVLVLVLYAVPESRGFLAVR